MSAAGVIPHPVIRPLERSDIAEVVAIEEASYPYPWTYGIFEDCLKAGYACFAVVLAGRVVAYSVQNWAAGESHLLNLCVDSGHRKRGVGRLLLDHTIELARRLDCSVMFLEVRPSNPAAFRLYQARGFRESGLRRDYYPAAGGREDAIVMRLDLTIA